MTTPDVTIDAEAADMTRATDRRVQPQRGSPGTPRPAPARRQRQGAPPAPRSSPDGEVAEPVGTFPRRTTVRFADGRRWDLLSSARETVATTSSGTVAGASIEDARDRVVIEFWTSTTVPHDVRIGLVQATFAHPAIRAERAVLLCVPANDSTVLTEARNHLDGAHSHVAGSTCLIEGRVPPRD